MRDRTWWAPRLSVAALLVILAVAGLRVAATWTVFSQTYDEAAHIAAGMELLDRGTYRGEAQHPPLARLAAAVGPFLRGVRLGSGIGLTEQGNDILHSNGDYRSMLAAARLGILPFFLMSIVAVWLFARRLGGDTAACVAALLYSMQPTVLAHAGVATTDMAASSAIILALYALYSWWETQRTPTAALFGFAAAAAFGAKFSSLLFLLIAVVALSASVTLSRTRPRRLAALRGFTVAAAVGTLTLWSIYAFHFRPLAPSEKESFDRLFPHSSLYLSVAPTLASIALPAPEFFTGIADTLLHNRHGHPSFLLGEHRQGGWWYYFPVAIAVKSTLPFLIFAIGAMFVAIAAARREHDYRLAGLMAAAVAIVVSCMPADINIGIRHLLPIYPLTAVAIGAAATHLTVRRSAAMVIVALLTADVATSARAHPDYLAYFNVLAGRHPERVLLDSNLDWGQDLLRLESRSKELKIESLQISYFGTADLSRHDLPILLAPSYDRPTPGWLAVSEMNIGSEQHPSSFGWLSSFAPAERIGRSIRLYRIPGETSRGNEPAGQDAILIPLALGSTRGANGSVWTSTLTLRNSFSYPVVIRDRSGFAAAVPPRGALVWPHETQEPRLLYVVSALARHISGDVRVQHDGSPGTNLEVPVIRPAASSIAAFSPLDLCDGCRATLRVYDLNPLAAGKGVRIRSGDAPPVWNKLERRDADGHAVPAWLLLPLSAEQLGPVDQPLRVESGEPSASRLWAMVTVTEPGGAMTVHLPH